mgnify:CR=1 FL=1
MTIDEMTHLILGEGYNGLVPYGRAKETTIANVKILSLEFQEISKSGRCMVIHKDELHKLGHKTRAIIKKKIIDESRKEDV